MADSDAEAAEHLLQLQQALPQEKAQWCRSLSKAVDEYEFEQALNLLTELEQRL